MPSVDDSSPVGYQHCKVPAWCRLIGARTYINMYGAEVPPAEKICAEEIGADMSCA